jgi:DNA-binding MarR family transcriptional regulator
MAPDQDRKDAKMAQIEDHLRRYGAESARIVDAFAVQHHMHATDLQALVIIMNAERQEEPMTAGQLARALNLTTGAVTGVVNRLETSGHVRRETDRNDRRQIRLHYAEFGMRLGIEFFGPLGERTNAIMRRYTGEELALIEGFLRDVVTAITEHRRELRTVND